MPAHPHHEGAEHEDHTAHHMLQAAEATHTLAEGAHLATEGHALSGGVRQALSMSRTMNNVEHGIEEAGHMSMGGGAMAGPALRAMGAVMAPLSIASGVHEVTDGVRNGDGLGVVQGATGVAGGLTSIGALAAGATGTLGALGSASAVAAPVIGAFGAGLAGGHLIDNAFRGMGTTEQQGRGVDGQTTTVQDQRSLSDRMGDLGHNATTDHAAIGMAHYLPSWLGGDRNNIFSGW